MASGGISLKELEESVSCPVCWDLYHEPQSLQCLHSLCKRCVNIWAKNGQVTCPQCRVVTPHGMLKLDFKIEAVVEWFKKEQQKLVTNSEPNEGQELSEQPEFCELCETAKAGLYCRDCRKVLCATCQRVHSKISACSKENTENLSVASARQAKVLQEQLVALSETSASLEKKRDRVKLECSGRKIYALAHIKQARQEVVAAVNSHFDLQEDVLECMTNIGQYEIESTYTKLQEQLKKCIQRLETLKLAKPSKIVQKSEELMGESKMCAQVVQTAMFSYIKTDIHQVEGNLASFNPKEALRIALCVKGYQAQGSRGCFKQLLGNKVHLEKKVELMEDCTKILMVNKDLWCLGEGVINVHSSQTGQHIKTKNLNIKYAWGAAVGPAGEDILIAAGYEGLKWLKTDGSNELVHIEDGMFHSVCHADEHFYVAQEASAIIFLDTFVKQGAGFIKSKSVPTELQGIGYPHSIAVMNNQIFISSSKDHVVYLLDYCGCIIQAWGRPGSGGAGDLHDPWLCESDSSGCLLVGDQGNHRFQVLQPENKDQPWTVVDIDAGIKQPRAALITKERKLFVAGSKPSMFVHTLRNQDAM